MSQKALLRHRQVSILPTGEPPDVAQDTGEDVEEDGVLSPAMPLNHFPVHKAVVYGQDMDSPVFLLIIIVSLPPNHDGETIGGMLKFQQRTQGNKAEEPGNNRQPRSKPGFISRYRFGVSVPKEILDCCVFT
ncbi:hypothetical protein MLD38_002439 [Melastoma candidum]|uniref:Uncharacterized protein n=1 Tax=Melastoma candidum TaxID=119954 RepID=A0ACB9S7W4_9MYRT|nr:hypothetical protein MLD38_002439 [Melastoma candidum]